MGPNKAISVGWKAKKKGKRKREKGFEKLLKLSVKIQIIICRLYKIRTRKRFSKNGVKSQF